MFGTSRCFGRETETKEDEEQILMESLWVVQEKKSGA